MTTMSDSGSSGYLGQPPFTAPPRVLRRSRTDRVISGVSGGLGEYFEVDPVIFRVLFAVLSFFGGIGLLAYGLAWLLIPEPEVNRSVLDKAVDQLRIHRVPPWLVLLAAIVVVCLGWFSWWGPDTLPAVILLALVALVLAHRRRNRPLPPAWHAPPPAAWNAPPPPGMPAGSGAPAGPGMPPVPESHGPTAAAGAAPSGLLWPTDATTPIGADEAAPELPTSGTVPGTDDGTATARVGQPETGSIENTSVLPGDPAFGPPADGATAPLNFEVPTGEYGWQPPPVDRPTAPLIAPLNDTRRSMQAWLAEAGEAHRNRVRRRRPIKVAVALALLLGWGLVAMFDALFRVPFPAYLWVGLGILGIGLLVSIATRRMTLSLLVPLVILGALAVALGGTRASLSDGSGRIGWLPTAQNQLDGNYRQFAGQSTLDLTQLAPLSSPASVTITQAAGEVVLRLPNDLNATVLADVHMGDIQNERSTAAGQFQAGVNVHLQLNPPATATGQPITIHVRLSTGHVQVDRVG